MTCTITHNTGTLTLTCSREDGHHGGHQDNDAGIYWHPTAEPPPFVSGPPTPTDEEVAEIRRDAFIAGVNAGRTHVEE